MNPFHIIVNLIKWLYDQLHPHPTVLISNSDSDSDSDSNYDSTSSVREAERIHGYSLPKPSLLEEVLTRSSFYDGTIAYQRQVFNSDSASFVRKSERILMYSFLKPRLLEEALTHSSFSNGTISNLEFVGDAALNLVITNYLYSSHQDLRRGRISMLRSANVSNERLARVAVRHNIYPLVRRNSPDLDIEVEEFKNAVKLEPEDHYIYGGITKKAPKVLANVVEAIAGAIYEDCNFNLHVMWKVVRRLLEPLITADNFKEQPVTKLHELCQKSGKTVEFPTRKKGNTTIVNVLVNGEFVSSGSAEQMDIANLNAARNALEKLCGEKSYVLKSQHEKVEDEEKAKYKLYAFCMKRHWPLPVYKLEEKKGPAHNRTFIYSVHVKTTNDQNLFEFGEDRSRVKDAKRSAALKMLSTLVEKLDV